MLGFNTYSKVPGKRLNVILPSFIQSLWNTTQTKTKYYNSTYKHQKVNVISHCYIVRLPKIHNVVIIQASNNHSSPRNKLDVKREYFTYFSRQGKHKDIVCWFKFPLCGARVGRGGNLICSEFRVGYTAEAASPLCRDIDVMSYF